MFFFEDIIQNTCSFQSFIRDLHPCAAVIGFLVHGVNQCHVSAGFHDCVNQSAVKSIQLFEIPTCCGCNVMFHGSWLHYEREQMFAQEAIQLFFETELLDKQEEVKRKKILKNLCMGGIFSTCLFTQLYYLPQRQTHPVLLFCCYSAGVYQFNKVVITGPTLTTGH